MVAWYPIILKWYRVHLLKINERILLPLAEFLEMNVGRLNAIIINDVAWLSLILGSGKFFFIFIAKKGTRELIKWRKERKKSVAMDIIIFFDEGRRNCLSFYRHEKVFAYEKYLKIYESFWSLLWAGQIRCRLVNFLIVCFLKLRG